MAWIMGKGKLLANCTAVHTSRTRVTALWKRQDLVTSELVTIGVKRISTMPATAAHSACAGKLTRLASYLIIPDSDPASSSDSDVDNQDSPPQRSRIHCSRQCRDSNDSDDGFFSISRIQSSQKMALKVAKKVKVASGYSSNLNEKNERLELCTAISMVHVGAGGIVNLGIFVEPSVGEISRFSVDHSLVLVHSRSTPKSSTSLSLSLSVSLSLEVSGGGGGSGGLVVDGVHFLTVMEREPIFDFHPGGELEDDVVDIEELELQGNPNPTVTTLADVVNVEDDTVQKVNQVREKKTKKRKFPPQTP
ncbi:hypothetical protein RHSIM_Rhsim12G0091200 [Rhododendron simsii]|uniref:Uncharacterized protein n=1 Tax=Rhododendron simsii TaxID=118357 RepID=A0A834G4M6_RHOSS|nr:hypothetical protein RHSIM_Rhsim12G0091200 [Rhododendron simsii]